MLQQNFNQIQSIIDQDLNLQHKAIYILINCSNKKDIPDELLNSIATLMDSTNSKEIKTSCYQLIDQISEIGKKVPNTIISILERS